MLLEFGVTPFGGLAPDTDRGGTPGTYVTAVSFVPESAGSGS